MADNIPEQMARIIRAGEELARQNRILIAKNHDLSTQNEILIRGGKLTRKLEEDKRVLIKKLIATEKLLEVYRESIRGGIDTLTFEQIELVKIEQAEKEYEKETQAINGGTKT